MKSFGWLWCAAAFLALSGAQLAYAGSYNFVANCDATGCSAGVPKSDSEQTVPPFAITHPLGYDREGGKIEIPICVSSTDPSLVGPTQRAIDTWNALVAVTQNCIGCSLFEETPSPGGDAFHAESVILHELGHCAMGLDHPNRRWDADNDNVYEPTSFTRSWGAAHPGGITAGADGIRGSSDDLHQAPGGPGKIAESVSWFRINDNNPVIVDATVIDSATYSRSVSTNLPGGHSWAASANRAVADLLLGAPSLTQSLMYGLIDPGQQYSGLSADEVNMVRMGMSGEDLMAGTADDYTVELVYVAECATEPDAIVVRFFDFTEGPTTSSAAECIGVDIDYSFPPPNPFLARHFQLVPAVTGFAPQIRLDESLMWNTDPPAVVLFADGFETGDLSEWDGSAP